MSTESTELCFIFNKDSTSGKCFHSRKWWKYQHNRIKLFDSLNCHAENVYPLPSHCGWNILPCPIGRVTSFGQRNFSGCDASSSCKHAFIDWLGLGGFWSLLGEHALGSHSLGSLEPEWDMWNQSEFSSQPKIQLPCSEPTSVKVMTAVLSSGVLELFVTKHSYGNNWLVHVAIMLLWVNAWK